LHGPTEGEDPGIPGGGKNRELGGWGLTEVVFHSYLWKGNGGKWG